MKGIELPVNVLVIIAIAVLVMLGMIALYVAGIIPAGKINEFSAMTEACGELKTAAPPCSKDTNKITINWDVSGDGKIEADDYLYDYCVNNKGCSDYKDPELCCKAMVCGCTGLAKPAKK